MTGRSSLKSIFLKELRTWTQSTSVVGPKAIYYTHMLLFMQTIWTIFFAFCGFITVWLYLADLKKYNMRLTTSSTTLEAEESFLTFPLITICRLNPIELKTKGTIPDSIERAYQMYMDEGDFRDESDAEFKQYCKKALKELFSSEQCDLMTKEPSRYKNGVPDTELEVDGGKMKKIAEKTSRRTRFQWLLRYFIVTRTESELRGLSGGELNRLLMRCTFNGLPCNDEDNFKEIRSLEYGLCYMFHNSKSKMNTTSGFKTPKLPPGVPFGLSLDLFSHSTAKQNLLKEDDGFIITVHEKGSTPYPHLNGVKVPLGEVTTLTIHEKSFEACSDDECEKCLKVTHEKPDEPVTKEDGSTDSDQDSDQHDNARKYYGSLKKQYENLKKHRISWNDCVKGCASEMISEECKCKITLSPFQTGVVDKDNICKLSDEVACALGVQFQVEKILNYFKNSSHLEDSEKDRKKQKYKGVYHDWMRKQKKSKHCECLPLCKETTYEEDQFFSRFPWQPEDDSKAKAPMTSRTSRNKPMNDVFNQVLARSKALYDLAEEATRQHKGCDKRTTNLNCFGKKDFPVEGEDALPEEKKRQLMKNQMSRVIIHFRTMQKVKTLVSLKYKIIDMLSDMGSQGGMWLGLNIMAILVFVELSITLFVYVIKAMIKHLRERMNRSKFEKQQAVREKAEADAPKRFVEVDIPIKNTVVSKIKVEPIRRARATTNVAK